MFKKNLSFIIRVLVSALFLLSAFTKLYPSPEIGVIKFFEHKQLIDGLGFNEMVAQYLSRFLIAFEFFIAISGDGYSFVNADNRNRAETNTLIINDKFFLNIFSLLTLLVQIQHSLACQDN
jgi:hypothetical protein